MPNYYYQVVIVSIPRKEDIPHLPYPKGGVSYTDLYSRHSLIVT